MLKINKALLLNEKEVGQLRELLKNLDAAILKIGKAEIINFANELKQKVNA